MYKCYKKGAEFAILQERANLGLVSLTNGLEYESESIRNDLSKMVELVQGRECMSKELAETFEKSLDAVLAEAQKDNWPAALTKFRILKEYTDKIEAQHEASHIQPVKVEHLEASERSGKQNSDSMRL